MNPNDSTSTRLVLDTRRLVLDSYLKKPGLDTALILVPCQKLQIATLSYLSTLLHLIHLDKSRLVSACARHLIYSTVGPSYCTVYVVSYFVLGLSPLRSISREPVSFPPHIPPPATCNAS